MELTILYFYCVKRGMSNRTNKSLYGALHCIALSKYQIHCISYLSGEFIRRTLVFGYQNNEEISHRRFMFFSLQNYVSFYCLLQTFYHRPYTTAVDVNMFQVLTCSVVYT